MSARTNLNNLKILFDSEVCEAHLPNGDVLEMKIKESYPKNGENTFYAKLEKKASGNVFKYVPGWISVHNDNQANCFGWLHYSYASDQQLQVHTSDGKVATYTFLEELDKKPKNLNKEFIIKSAQFSHKPHEE